MGKFSPTADLQVGTFFKDWIVSVNGSEVVTLDERSNLWGLVASYLEKPAQPWAPLKDRTGYISIQLLNCDGKPRWNIPEQDMIYVNEEYRFAISQAGQASICRYLKNQLYGVFRAYMVGRFSDDDSEPIRHAIGSFLCDFNLPINDTIISNLSKAWYRYRQKNPINNSIPIFF